VTGFVGRESLIGQPVSVFQNEKFKKSIKKSKLSMNIEIIERKYFRTFREMGNVGQCRKFPKTKCFDSRFSCLMRKLEKFD